MEDKQGVLFSNLFSAACDGRVRLAAEQFRRRLTAAEGLRRGLGADRELGLLGCAMGGSRARSSTA